MRAWQGVVLSACLFCAAAFSTRLGDVAAQMKTGEWVSFECGLTDEMFRNGAGNMLDFSTQMEWDGRTRRLMYMGESHAGSGGLAKVLIYAAVADTAFFRPTPREPQRFENRMGHSYD